MLLDWVATLRLDESEALGLIATEIYLGNNTSLPILTPVLSEGSSAMNGTHSNTPIILSTQLSNHSSAALLQTWNITAADVDPTLTSSRLQTQRQPTKGHLDILAIGESYIRGATGVGSNATNNSLSLGSRDIKLPRNIGPRSVSPFTPYTPLAKREGPIQCSASQPCLDESCCNSDGKCGFKETNCGATCLSNCDAKAMCGIDSIDGKTGCGLKLCCSYYGWCGTKDVHCNDPEPQIGLTPCQQGYGSCSIAATPTCGKFSGTSSGRRVGYYQGWNTRERLCDKVSPSQINTRGLSHLFYSFAFFHPQTFAMMPMNEGDVKLYGEFNALKRNGLQTWIAVGGVSNPFHILTKARDTTSTSFPMDIKICCKCIRLVPSF